MGMVEITGSHTVAKLYVVIIEEIYHFTNIFIFCLNFVTNFKTSINNFTSKGMNKCIGAI